MTDGPKPLTHYRADIDGLRAIAVLIVVVSHFFPYVLPGGFVGVDVFFVISGYLITQVLSQSVESSGTFSLGSFYKRRVLRIFPALFLVLLASWGIGWHFLLSQEFSALSSSIKSSAFFIQNITLYKNSGYFAPPSELNPLLHIWSLAVEEQFYLFYPLFLLLVWGRRHSAIFLGVILSLAWNFYATHTNPPGAFYLPFGRAWELLLGAWIYVRETKTSFPLRACFSSCTPLATLGLALILTAAFAIDRTSEFPGFLVLLPVIGSALLITTQDSILNKHVLSQRFLVWIGLVSYPLYLWHWPLLAFTRILMGAEPSAFVKLALILLSGLLSVLTYLYFEKPIRFGKPKLRTRFAYALLVLVFAVGGLGFFTELKGGFPHRVAMSDSEKIATQMKEAESRLREKFPESDCSGLPEMFSRGVDCMSYGNAPGKRTIVIWGDSHAGSWRYVFYSIAKDLNFRVFVFRHPGCPPLLGTRRRTWERGSPIVCEEFGLAEDVLRVLTALKPEYIFISARWSNYFVNPPFFLTQDTEPESVPPTPESAKAALTTKIPVTLRALRVIAPVTVIYEMPQLKESVDSKKGGGIAQSRELFEPDESLHLKQKSFTREIFQREIVFEAPGLHPIDGFDPAELTCFDGVCHSIINSTVLYLDDNHVSPAGSMLFESMLHRYFMR